MKIETNKVYCMDAFELLKQLPDESIDLVVTDPPYYNFVKEEWDRQWVSLDDYLNWINNICLELCRVLKKGGTLYLFGTHRIISYIQILLDKYEDLSFQNYLSWVYTMGIALNRNFSNQQEAILYYCKKGKDKIFNNNSIRVLSQRQVSGDKRAGKDGKVPPNWFLCNRIQGNNKERTEHPTQKPLKLIRMLIQASSNKNDLIFDPFLGSGTTAVACKQLERNFICCDNNQDYVAIANKRLEQQSVTDFTSATPTLEKPKEFNISLKDNSNELSQISSNDETSLNNNIHRLRPNSLTHSQVRRNLTKW